jgi:tetratricopeptide (TPR) repeat protein
MERAGVGIVEPRLLNPGAEWRRCQTCAARADLVLVDAPCSGSGTWRRNPETRWRLTPDRLGRLVALQAALLDIAAELVRPGGLLVYAVCSLLSEEGRNQAARFAERRSAWVSEPVGMRAGGSPVRPGSRPEPGRNRRLFRRTVAGAMLSPSPDGRMETLMRLTPIALSVALAVATMASAGHGQRPDDQIDPKSQALLQQGQAQTASGMLNQAIDTLETALVVDPRNRAAYVALARVAQAQKLPGKATRLYGEALKLERTTSARWRGRAKLSCSAARWSGRSGISSGSRLCARIRVHRPPRSRV